MKVRKNIFAIIGSASENSANEKLVDLFVKYTHEDFNVTVFKELKSFPHFDPQLSIENTPLPILKFREQVEKADGLLFCTPEYVFSIPSGLKNAIEWCVSTIVFSDKPTGIITASAHGQKGHEELQLILKTVMCDFTDDNCLLIQGIKGKIDKSGEITDNQTKENFNKFIESFKLLVQ